MRRSARLSTINTIESRQKPQDSEDSIRDVTDILNAEASNVNRTPSSKRKRKSTQKAQNEESPTKRREVEDLPKSTPANPPQSRTSTIRSSGKLKARSSLVPRPPPSRRNDFDLPESPTDEPEARNLIIPPVRMRVLNKRKQLPVSPFRGRGELDTRSTAMVHLDDSPRKIVTKNRLQKIGTSFLKLKSTAHQQASTNVPFDGDVLAQALVASDGPDTPILFPSQSNNAASTDAEPNTPVKRKIPQSSGRRAKRGARKASAASAVHEQEHMSQSANMSNPLAHAVAATQNERDSPKPGTKIYALPELPATARLVPAEPLAVSRRGEQELNAPTSRVRQPPKVSKQIGPRDVDEDDNINNNEGVPDPGDADDRENDHGNEPEESDDQEEHQANHDVQEPRQRPRVQRPETEAGRRRRQQAESEQEDTKARRIRKAMSGIDEAAEMFGCKIPWRAALVASAEIIDERAYTELRSTNGKAVARSLRSLVELYRELSRQNFDLDEDCTTNTVQQDLQVYRQRCLHISGYRHAPVVDRHQERKRERRHLIWDIYEYLIPDSLKLAKYILRARYQNSTLAASALKEVMEVLKNVRLLGESAAQWKPKVPAGVKRKTLLEIKQNVDQIIAQYQKEVALEDQKSYRDVLEIRQRADREQFLTEVERRRAANREKHRPYAARMSRKPVDQITDIDDLNLDEQFSQYGHRETSQPTRVDTTSGKHCIQYQSGPEIPPAKAVKWHPTEIQLLVDALQKYTSITRFADIVAVFGGPRGKLGRYNINQIFAQARWIKWSMLRGPYDLSDGQWDWLLSLPD
ncbi:hypothetical protein H2204_003027 [Knufia peltigerae]|uniref:Uncharacterized protein n=1 Tax=Knufia peltigerae TaxID=1002370 RepID=A0AA38YA21_9EURO|nr:hypothetical protein H2204_003027 [Knufia peltigerae]